MAAIGYPAGNAPVADLAEVRPGAAGRRLEVPGVGSCVGVAVTLEHPPRRHAGGCAQRTGRPHPCGNRLPATDGPGRGDEDADAERRGPTRAARAELERLAAEQEALRRVAMMVAEATSPEEVFTAVAAWARAGRDITIPVGTRLPVSGTNVHTLVFRTGRPARLDNVTEDAGPALAPSVVAGIRSGWARRSGPKAGCGVS